MIPKKKMPKLEPSKIKQKKQNTKQVTKKLQTRLPKSEYDETGTPILNIEIDDLDLNNTAFSLLNGGVYDEET